MMNKEKKYAIAKLWVAGAILMALCLVTDLYAQEPVVTGPDNSCRLDFDPELDNKPIMLNNWIRM